MYIILLLFPIVSTKLSVNAFRNDDKPIYLFVSTYIVYEIRNKNKI